ncbi:MAG: dTMP kinase [Candidatus Beckwithbacteria bacterium]
MLIVLEGIDGSGKATQAKMLNPDFLLAFPRYDKFIGKVIQLLLQFSWGQRINPYLFACLFAADRWLAKPKINYWLKQGKTVVIDRYTGSSQAHQGAKYKAEKQPKIINWIDWLENKIFKLPRPDKVFFLNLAPDKTKQLMAKRGREKDAAEKDFYHQKKAYEIYQLLAKRNKWIIINSLDKQEKVLTAKEIHEKIISRLN